MANDDQELRNDLASLRIRPEDKDDRPTRRWLWALVLIAVVGLGAFLYRGQKDKIAGFGPAAEVQLGQVSLISPSQADVQLVATGYVASRKKAQVSARVPGRIVKLYVDEGDTVKAGQLLAELDRADTEAQLSTARSDAQLARAKVEEARATLLDAETRAKRDQVLVEKGAGAPSTVEDAALRVALAKAQLQSAIANVDAIQTRIRSAEVALDYTKVRAPFDGTVLRKHTEVGEVANPTGMNQAGGVIYTIAGLDELQVEADVSETQLAKVLAAGATTKPNTTPLANVGHDKATGAPAEIVLDAFPDRRFRGVVAEVRPTVDRAKATVVVKVRFVDPTDGVLPDMSAKVSFLSRPIDEKAVEQSPKRVVQGDAVVEREGKKVVFAVDKDRVHAAPVQVKGPLGSAGLLELSEGPAPGTRVVRSPAPDLADGARIKVPD